MVNKVVVESDERFSTSLGYVKGRVEAVGAKAILRTQKDGTVRLDVRNLADVEVLRDAIADVIVNDCKAHYILENMKLPIRDSFDRHLFISALCEFDREMDKYLTMEILQMTPTIVLSGYYDFKLGNLKIRWDEICMIANENIENLVAEGNFFELLRYLISNLEHRIDEAFLECIDGKVRVYDRQMKPLVGVYANESQSEIERAISVLVSHNPRRIFFWGGEVEFFNRLRNLFGGCMEISRPDELLQIHHS